VVSGIRVLYGDTLMIKKIVGFITGKQPPKDVREIIKEVSEKKKVNYSLALSIAKIESALNVKAKAKTSSALGLYQFIDSTWANMINTYGSKNGIEDIGDRTNPEHSTLMFCELVKENERYLKRNGHKNLSDTDFYLAHFLGPRKAHDFISARDISGKKVAKDLFPLEAKANPSVFYNKDTPRTLNEVYDLFSLKLKKALEKEKV
jgi:hypothetical protein